MRFDWRNIIDKLIYDIGFATLTALIIISITIKYVANTSIWHAANINIFFAEHLIAGFLVLFMLIFILLQILSKMMTCKKIWAQSIKPIGKNDINYLLAVFTLTFIGGYLRFIQLDHQSFWMDEAITANAAISLLKNGIPIFPSGIIYDRSILNILLVALSFETFGINEFAGRLSSVIFGTLSIPMTYLLGKKLGNKNIGLAATILMTFSILMIGGSRECRMYAQLQFFYIISLYLFYIIVEEKNVRYAPLFVVTVISALLSHSFAYALIGIFLVYLILTAVIPRVRDLNNWWTLIKNQKMLAALFVTFTCLILFLGEIIGVVSVLQGTNDQFTYYKTFLIDTYSTLYYLSIYGILLCIATMLFMKRKKELLLLLAFCIPFYTISYHLPLTYDRYLYFILPIFFILSTYLIGWIIELIQISASYEIKHQLIKIGAIILIISAIIVPSPAFTLSHKEYYSINADFIHTDYSKVFNFVNENMQKSDILISIVSPLALYYTGKSDYLLRSKNYKDISFTANGVRRDNYANSLVVSNLSTLEQVVKNNARGWMVVDKGRESWVSEDIRVFIKENMLYHTEISDKMISLYSWDAVPSSGTVSRYSVSRYSDNFNTDKWNVDKQSSYGVGRSLKSVIASGAVLYPTIADKETYVRYKFNIYNQNNTFLTTTGNRRDTEHNLTVWASQDNITYTKIIKFETVARTTKHVDISSYVTDNQTWIVFRFLQSSKGENVPRILNFSITAVPKNNQIIEITPFGNNRLQQSGTILRYTHTNLLAESSFEHYKDSKSTPIAWSFTSSNSGTADIDNTGFDGNYSYRVSSKNGREGFADMSQIFDMSENEYYRLNATHKHSGNGNAIILVQWFDDDWKLIKEDKLDLAAKEQWDTSSIEKITPLNTKHGKVILRYQTKAGDSGMVWFDDIKLQAAITNNRD